MEGERKKKGKKEKVEQTRVKNEKKGKCRPTVIVNRGVTVVDTRYYS